MAKKSDQQLLVSLDIGTSKIVTLVGEVNDNQQIHIIGMGSAPSYGMKRGVVVDIEQTVESIQKSVSEAENTAGCKINSAFTGIAGSHIDSMNSHGVVAVKTHEITQADVDRVIDAAKAVPLPADQKILHILPQDFIIDNQSGIREPIGMAGVRLEARVHMVTGAISAAQNIMKCVQRCGLQASDIILEQLASSCSVLTEDEKELGVCLVDIGGGTTDLAVFTGGAIRHTAVIPIAGDQVTQDIAIALRIPTQHAELIKLQHGCALGNLIDHETPILLHDLGEINTQYTANRPLSQKMLAEFIEPRYEELFYLINQQLKASGLKEFLGAGIVLTGGATLAKGVPELAKNVLELPVRVGTPRTVTGLEDILNNPMYATSVGLLNYGHQQHFIDRLHDGAQGSVAWKHTWGKIKHWFGGQF
jgi:cell division protein FtsA